MTTHGILVLCLMGIALLLWILDLVRSGRLYVGYAAIFVVAIAATILTLLFPPVLATVSSVVGANLPASALTLLALGFIVVMLVYVFTQITVISNRLTAVVQELAIRGALEARGGASRGHDGRNADS
jgi:hypothetical protein